nr:integrase, catalytic region, zinc finger, CCHC-type, peptidase aspartic, catalytic [Tanacetum cinerariifolium]
VRRPKNSGVILKKKGSSNTSNVDLDTFSSVRRPKHNSVIWKKKGSSNTSNVGLSAVSVSNLNKNVKRYSRKDLLACNNSHPGETSSASVCNNAMNVSYDSRMNDLLDDNNFLIFDDVNIFQICLWIIDSGCSKHMTGNRALLTKSVEKFLGTIRFGHNDFAVIAGYGDVVIGSMTIKKVYYVEGLGHNLFSVGQFCDKGLEVAFRKSTCFVRNEDGVDLLTGDRSSNLYTIALNEVASNSLTCIIAKASSSQCWLWHQRLSHLNFATINNHVKKSCSRCCLLNDYDDVGKLKAKGDIGVFVGYSKESAAFRNYNKRNRKIHESVNVNFDEISKMASKQFSLEPGLSNLNETGKSSNLLVSQVSEASKTDLEDLFQKFYDEYFHSSKIMKCSTTNVETPINEEVFHEVSESFQRESSSFSLNDDVQQSPKEVILPSTNTQSISINMIPNGDETAERYLEEAKPAIKEEANPAKEETEPTSKKEGKDDKKIVDRGNEEDGPDSRARGDRFYHNRRFADRGNEKVDRDPGNISEIKRLRRRVRDLEIQHKIRKIRKRIRELELHGS